jgi:uncharacterized lipoprotein NlpE involved in copper resistance
MHSISKKNFSTYIVLALLSLLSSCASKQKTEVHSAAENELAIKRIQSALAQKATTSPYEDYVKKVNEQKQKNKALAKEAAEKNATFMKSLVF